MVIVGWFCRCKTRRIDRELKAKIKLATHKLREKVSQLESSKGIKIDSLPVQAGIPLDDQVGDDDILGIENGNHKVQDTVFEHGQRRLDTCFELVNHKQNP